MRDETQCAYCCAEKGLVKDARACRRHRCERPIKRHKGTHGLKWYCGKCDRGESILTGSVFDDLRMELPRAVMLIHCFAWNLTYEQAKLACQLDVRDTVVHDDTISSWYDKLRDRIVDYAANQADGLQPIGGPGRVVQVDEAQIGRRKYHVGRVYQDTWVVGMIDDTGDLRLAVTPDRSASSLQTIVQKHVKVGSELHTDGWRAYRGLSLKGYSHRTVNHKEEFVASDGTHTQRIESQWRNIRRKISQGGKRHENMTEYLLEHLWRRDCRRRNLDPFLELVKLLKYEG